jgi:hypothetical protein
MLKKIVILCCAMLTCQVFLMSAEKHANNQQNSVYYSSQLKNVMKIIEDLPDAKHLIAKIQKEGKFNIVVNKGLKVCEEFGACWNPDTRTIIVNSTLTSQFSKGALIGSILFELQNAAVDSKIHYYNSLAAMGKISQEDYVRSMEYLEYENSHKAAALAKKGIELGIFPKSAYLPTYSNFEEHYKAQRMSGHSAYFARNYKQIRSNF